MKRTTEQQGFTLIELIVVIVILGILAATALPKFVDLKGDAAQSAVQGAAAALSSGFSLNYAKFLVNSTAATRFSAASACAGASTSIATLDSAKFAVATDASCAGSTAGATALCTLQSQDDTTKTATATVICTG